MIEISKEDLLPYIENDDNLRDIWKRIKSFEDALQQGTTLYEPDGYITRFRMQKLDSNIFQIVKTPPYERNISNSIVKLFATEGLKIKEKLSDLLINNPEFKKTYFGVAEYTNSDEILKAGFNQELNVSLIAAQNNYLKSSGTLDILIDTQKSLGINLLEMPIGTFTFFLNSIHHDAERKNYSKNALDVMEQIYNILPEKLGREIKNSNVKEHILKHQEKYFYVLSRHGRLEGQAANSVSDKEEVLTSEKTYEILNDVNTSYSKVLFCSKKLIDEGYKPNQVLDRVFYLAQEVAISKPDTSKKLFEHYDKLLGDAKFYFRDNEQVMKIDFSKDRIPKILAKMEEAIKMAAEMDDPYIAKNS